MRGLVETRVVSGVVLALGLALLVPLALSLLYRDGSWASFLWPGAAMALAGGVGLRVTAPLARTQRYLSNRDVYLSVTLAWVVAAPPRRGAVPGRGHV
jgi:Trk-type K+ transport system membrane component